MLKIFAGPFTLDPNRLQKAPAKRWLKASVLLLDDAADVLARSVVFVAAVTAPLALAGAGLSLLN